jgi:hypothetical protein
MSPSQLPIYSFESDIDNGVYDECCDEDSKPPAMRQRVAKRKVLLRDPTPIARYRSIGIQTKRYVTYVCVRDLSAFVESP